METLIAEVKSKGDTIGGIITCVAKGVPVGLGEPVFGKLHGRVGTCDAYDQRREGLRVWRRIQRRLLPRIGKERSLFQ